MSQYNILVINCGSSSLKFEVFATFLENKIPKAKSLCKGIVERIGASNSIFSYSVTPQEEGVETESIKETLSIDNHEAAFHKVISTLTDSKTKIIADVTHINAVGHRVVHGGEKYSHSVIIDDAVKSTIKALSPFAPLHNPANLDGIKAAEKIFSHCPHVAVFDTAFHQTMPQRAFMYALPYELYKKHGIRRYGFHGTSHFYVSRESARRLGKSPHKVNLITCHLGNGCSITAIEQGRSVETSMGFTPLQGVMMGTRSGDIDPAILVYLESQGMSSQKIDTLINKESGLLGISGVSNDMRDIQEAAVAGNERAELALEMFALSVQKHIGAYAGLLHTVDMLVFTAGIGQNDVEMRERICEPLYNLGMAIDKDKNRKVGRNDGIISTDFSTVAISVIATKEELQIALDTYELVSDI